MPPVAANGTTSRFPGAAAVGDQAPDPAAGGGGWNASDGGGWTTSGGTEGTEGRASGSDGPALIDRPQRVQNDLSERVWFPQCGQLTVLKQRSLRWIDL